MAIPSHGLGQTAPVPSMLPIPADAPVSCGAGPDLHIQAQDLSQVSLFKPKIRRRSPRRAMLPFKHVLTLANLAYVLSNSQLGGSRRANSRTRAADRKLDRSAKSLLEGLAMPLPGPMPGPSPGPFAGRAIVSRRKQSAAVGDQPRRGDTAGQQSTPPWLPAIERHLGRMEYTKLEAMRNRLAHTTAESSNLVRAFAQSLQGLGYDDLDVIGGARPIDASAAGPAAKVSGTAKQRRKNTAVLIRHLKNSLSREIAERDRPLQALVGVVSRPYPDTNEIDTAWRDLFDTVQLRWRHGETTPKFLAAAMERLSDDQIGWLADSLFLHPST